MTKSWSYAVTQDKLRVFVSSRLHECKAERAIAHQAIALVNHQAVLFEHLGARSIPPRDLYLSRLRDSQMMIAIYREGYGYVDVANGMPISGLEDEFRFAESQKIETLFYVFRDATSRDPRLAAIIAEAGAKHTLSYYSRPDELRDRIRDDLTALITSRFLSADTQQRVLNETSTELLGRQHSRSGFVLARDDLVRELQERLRRSYIICVVGPPGIGKTTLAAQLAEAEHAIFLRVAGLSPKELFAVCAAALSSPAVEPQSYSTLPGAMAGFGAKWSNTSRVTLIIDECDYIDEVVVAIATAGGVSVEKRVVFTSREAKSPYQIFVVPPLLRAEVQRIVEASTRGATVDGSIFEETSPLALQRALAISEGTRTSTSDESSGRELLAYLSLSEIPLTAENLIGLLGDDRYSIEKLYDELRKLGRLVDDSPRGIRLMHSETAAELREELGRTPQRLRFYANRLLRLFSDLGDHRLAYRIASMMGDGSEELYAFAALRQSARLGDWRLARGIADRLLAMALDRERNAEAFELMLLLVYPLELMGDAVLASEFLKKAKMLAATLGEDAIATVEEQELASHARRTLSVSDIAKLEEIRARYRELGRHWDAARVEIELSALHISAKAYERAVKVLRPALRTLQDVGDEYGVDISQRNLASALSAISGNDQEVEELVREIDERATKAVDHRRQRAWLCNILTRKYRSSGRYADAEALAREAIEIGRALGDESLSAINFVNLGNILSDQAKPSDALEAYAEAGRAAQKCGRRDVEADSSRLQAGVLNDLPDETAGFRDRRQKAQAFAEHAVGLLAETVYYEGRARAFVELGQALHSQNEEARATRAYFDAAAEFKMVPDEDGLEHALKRASFLGLPKFVEEYLLGITKALGASRTESATLSTQFINLIGPIVAKCPVSALVPILGSHLQCVRSKLPPLLQPALAKASIDALRSSEEKQTDGNSATRLLHAGIVLALLLKSDARSFLYAKLAESVSQGIAGLDTREVGNGRRVWTVVLELKQPVTLTIESLDETPEAILATFVLALFLKAFETEMRDELVAVPMIHELLIEVASYSAMPEDLRSAADRTMGIGTIMAEQSCAVSRPVSFADQSPTLIFLSPSFLDELAFGERVGGSLQVLFGLTVVELAFQLLRGEVSNAEIQRKAVSLVRKTLS